MTPQLVEFYKGLDGKKDRKLEIVLVNHDSNQKGMDQYMTKSKINFPGLKHSESNKNALATATKVEYLPTIVLTDANGKVVASGYGADCAKVIAKAKAVAK